MYAVDDETFQRARSLLVAAARELGAQQESGILRPVDLQELVRRSAAEDLAKGEEAGYLAAVSHRLELTFPVEELFPRKRRRRADSD